MKSGIYKITCKPTGKIYIGLSKRMKSRFQKHLADLKNGIHGNPYMKNTYEKYGREAFEFSILEYCEPEVLYEREHFWINHLDSSNPDIGFNIIVDLKREKERLNKCNSKEYREKLGKISKKRWEDPEYAKMNIEAIRKTHKEREARGEVLSCLTPESKKKAYDSCHTPEFLKGLSERTYKQLEDPEYRALALKNLEKGRNNPITKVSMSKAKKKNWEDPIFREKMIEAGKAKWKDPEFRKIHAEKTRQGKEKKRKLLDGK